ncbi:MAG: RNA 2',3'-cyclic phosphodiesterase [Bryobacteraceae bacterium]
MRIFTAIDLPSTALLRLERLLSVLRPEAQINWSPLDNLHITTKFIGQWPEERFPELTNALSSLLPCRPFQVELKNLGWFPNGRSPRVLWVGVHGGDGLAELARRTEEKLQELGVPKESREFSPHLTLARIKRPVSLSRLKQIVGEIESAEFGEFPVSSFALFRSDPGSNSSIYRKLRDFHFQAAMAAS